MIKNWLRIALTNWLTHKLYAAINVLGLSVGLVCFLLIMLFVRYELGYDSFFPDADRIYRVSPDYTESTLGPERHPAGAPATLAPLLREAQFDGVEAVARIGGQHALVARGQRVFYEENFRWADPEIFDIFRFQWLSGTAEDALSAPLSVVLSETMARKLFDRTDVLGETFELENSWILTVTGVIADIPANSHLSADLIVGMDTAWAVLEFDYSRNWFYTNFHTYVLLEEGATSGALLEQLRATTARMTEVPVFAERALDFTAAPFTAYPLEDIHLYGGREGEMRAAGSVRFVATFSAIAACLLLIACINFMNLSTARASTRVREVGMRKTLGANRSQLILQFLGEALAFAGVALILALVVIELLLPVFSALIDRPLQFSTLFEPGFFLFMIAITLGTGVVAGAYPAFYLSAFNPARVLKPDTQTFAGGTLLRNALVVVQFFIAITLIVATLVVYKQMQYVKNSELGFARERMVILWGTHNEGLGASWPALKQEFLQQGGITHVTEADMYPGRAADRRFRVEGGTPEGLNMLAKRVGFGFFDTYDIALRAGRYLDESFSTDVFLPPPNVEQGVQPTGNYVLNETAARQLGWTPETAIGKRLEMDFSNDFSLVVAGQVVGVVEDIHLESLHEPIRPLVYYTPALNWGSLPSFDIATVRLAEGNIEQALAAIDATWRRFNPDIPLLRHFLDTDFEALYQNEERQGQLFTLFALLTIGLACLGLFGLASYTVERRRKEIGVRKVFGGSVWRIVLLLTHDFSRLVLIANVLAWPLAYVAMSRWLENFAYRIDLTPLIFIGSGLIALSIAWATVGGTAAKAANAKPVLALRYE
jgi:putative ABC transport system permease protein